MKRILLGSMIAAALLLTTGCGGDDKKVDAPGVTADTTAPTIGATATGAIDTAITLATDNTAVTTMTIAGADAGSFTKSGATATATTAGTYNIIVTAADAAANSATQAVVVTVTGGGTPDPVATENKVDLGNLGTWIVVQAKDVEDNATTDVNETSFARVSYDKANTYCGNLGTDWVLPTKEDLATLETSNVLNADVTDATGQIILNANVVPSGVVVLWTSTNAEAEGFYLGSDSDAGNPESASADFENAWYTCVKK